MKAILAIKEGDGWVQVTLGEAPFRIGRDPASDYALRTGFISRNHCEIFREGEQWFVRDLGSKLGTQVNGKGIHLAPLKDADTLTCGHKFTAQFRIDRTRVHQRTAALPLPDLPPEGTSGVVQLPNPPVSSHTGMRLIAENGPVANQVFPLTADSVRMGRHIACEIQVPLDTVSQFHAELNRTDSGMVLTDLNSSNGTYINERRIHRQVLAPGDRVRLDSVIFRFESENYSVSRSGTRIRGELLKDLEIKGDDRVSQQYPELQPDSNFSEQVLVRAERLDTTRKSAVSARGSGAKWLWLCLVLLLLGALGLAGWRWGDHLLEWVKSWL